MILWNAVFIYKNIYIHIVTYVHLFNVTISIYRSTWYMVMLAKSDNNSCAMECDEGTFDHIAGGLSGVSGITIDLDESDTTDGDGGHDGHGNTVASTSLHSDRNVDDHNVTFDAGYTSDCEGAVCTHGDGDDDSGINKETQHAYDLESAAHMLDNSDDGRNSDDDASNNNTGMIHQHGRHINDSVASVPQIPSGGDGDAAAGPQFHDDTNDDNNMSSGSGSEFNDSAFDRLGYHFCSDCIQCGRCESCGYVLRMRRTVYSPAPSSGHSCVYYRLGRHQCTACWVTGICDVCNDTLRDYRPNHEFSDWSGRSNYLSNLKALYSLAVIPYYDLRFHGAFILSFHPNLYSHSIVSYQWYWVFTGCERMLRSNSLVCFSKIHTWFSCHTDETNMQYYHKPIWLQLSWPITDHCSPMPRCDQHDDIDSLGGAHSVWCRCKLQSTWI